jgi:hypothetical protein
MNKLRVAVIALTVAIAVAGAARWAYKRVKRVDYAPVAADVLARAQPILSRLPLRDLNLQVQNGNLGGARAHVALYAAGKRLEDAWGVAKDVEGAVAVAWQSVSGKASASKSAVISIVHDKVPITRSNQKGLLSDTHRGVWGMMVLPESQKEDTPGMILKSPTFFVAGNRSFTKQLEQIAKDQKLETKDLVAAKRVSLLVSRQFYLDLASATPAQELLRGNVLIRPEEVTHESLQAFAGRMSEWMRGNVQQDGREVYLYFPSRGEESKENNTIRQLMATICLGRIAKISQDASAREVADRNLRYNMKVFYKETDGLGGIEYDGNSKLGAIALAVGAIMESPIRAEFAKEEAGLRRAIDHLWQPDGSFRSFLVAGKEKEDALTYQNFYPGEALLSLAMTFAETQSEDLNQKILTSARYYKEWHLKNRNPAFVPWHSEAYYIMWQQRKHAELKDWIFEMNDWLLGMQERSMVEYEDTLGRFYDPERPKYGGPHASSTGVYLEGLIDAFALAREVGDEKRVQKYRRAILLGLRDAMQLEFGDEIDWFYVAQPEKVRGGLRSTVSDNQIRVDNVQHVLMGLQKILTRFKPEDYAPVTL